MRFVLVVLLLACTRAPAARAGPEKPPEGTLRFALVGKIDTLDPATFKEEPARICIGNVFDQLYEHAHADGPYRLRPALAAALPRISEDGLTQTIRLRRGVHFVDDRCFPDLRGREVTAHDVVFCLKRLMDAHVESPYRWMFERKIRGLDRFTEASRKPARNPTRSAYQTTEGYTEVKGLEVVDDHTLRIHLLEPTPELAWMLASVWCSVYAPEAVRTYGADLGRTAIGTGPYRVLLLEGGHKLTLRRNPRYREERASGQGADGPLLPRNDTVVVTAHQAANAAWASFLAEEADVAEVARDAFTATVDPRTGRLLPHLAKRGVTLHRDPRLEIFYDAFSMRDAVLGAPAGERGRALRTAICLATDDRWAMERLYTHHAERVYGPILPEFASYRRGFTNENLPVEGESREDALAAAREVLEDAGVDAAQVPVLKMHILGHKTSRLVFDIFRRQLADLDLRVEPVVVTWPEMRVAIREGKVQIWTTSWHADYPDAQNFLQCFYSRSSPEVNATRYAHREFDEAYLESRRAQDEEERQALMREMQAIVVEDAVWRYRFRRIRWTATSARIEGYRYNGIAPKAFKHCAVKPSR